MQTANRNIKVSIVIAAFNEEKKIGDCLRSLAKQSYKNLEVILVNDCSSDKTVLVAKQVNNVLRLNLRIIQLDQHQERGFARNKGAKCSLADYLLFLDADMKLSRDVITRCLNLAQKDAKIKAIIIPEKSFGEGFWANCRRLEKLCYIGDDWVEAARFFDRKAFWNVGGWDNKMISGEDWDLTYRIRSSFRVERVNSFILHNEYHLTLGKAMKKKFYYASVSGTYLEKHPLNLINIIIFIFRPSFMRNWKLIIADPVHGIGMFFLKAMELSAGGAGYLFSKLPHLQ